MQSNQLEKFQYPSLLIIAALQVSLTLAAATVGYEIISLGFTIQSGATFIFPLTYVLSDIVAEVYGYKIARKLIWITLGCEIIFGIAVTAVINLPNISSESEQSNQAVLGNTWRFITSGFFAVVISDFMNISLISKWKILAKGKYFCLRSVGSTAVATLFLIIITIGIAFYGKLPNAQILHLMVSAYLLELFYAFIFVYPAFFLAEYIKRKEKIDFYDIGINYNPFKR